MSLTASEKSLRGQIGAYTSWSRTEDRSARTAPARKAALQKFEQQVDPNGELSPDERARRAQYARKAYFKQLALKSAQARRRRESDRQAEAAELARLAEIDGLLTRLSELDGGGA